MRRWLIGIALLSVVTAGCTSDEDGRDAAVIAGDAAADRGDALAFADAGPAPDAIAADAAPDPSDALAADALAADAAPAPDAAPAEDASAPDAAMAPMMRLTSPTITEGGTIPRDHVCARRRGADEQPALDFIDVPAGTQSLAMVLIDDTIDFVHWIALDIPAGTTGLARDASGAMMLPAGTREIPAYGTQYAGPCPGSRHTYTFRLYALSVPMTTFQWPRDRNISASHLMRAFDANTLAVATLTGTFTP